MVLIGIGDNHLHWLAGFRNLIMVVGHLSALTLAVHKHHVTLIDCSLVGAAVGSLLVVSTQVLVLSVTHSNAVVAHILVLLVIKIENITLAFLGIGSSCSNTSWVMHDVHGPTNASDMVDFLSVSIPHEGFIISI